MRKIINTSFFVQFYILLFLFCSLTFFYSQDTLHPDKILNSAIQKDFKNEEKKISKSKQFFIDNQNSRKQKAILSNIEEEIQKANLILKKGIDYKDYTTELQSIVSIKKTAVEGDILHSKSFLSNRNLTLTSIMLNEVLLRTTEQLEKIKKNGQNLANSQTKIDSLIIRDELFLTPKDAKSKEIYLQKYNQVTQNVEALNQRFKTALDSINALEINANKFKFELQDNIITVEKLRNKIQNQMFSEDYSLFNAKTYSSSLGTAFLASIIKEIILVAYYIANHIQMFLLIFLAIVFIYSFLKILKRKYAQAGFYEDFKYPIQIFDHPFLVAVIISVTILQFFFPNPPFALLSLFWTILLFSLAFIARKTNSKKQTLIWRVYGFLVFVSFFINNILVPSLREVYLLLALSLITILSTIYFLKKHKSEFLNPMPKVLRLVVFLEVLGFIFLLKGNYNFGKDLVILGVFTIFLGYLFITTMYKILDIIKFSDYLKEPEDDMEKHINLFQYELYNISGFKYFLLILAWVIIVFRSTYWYRDLLEPFNRSLSEIQSIGSFKFTFGNILLFFAVIFVAYFISKIVSFLSTGIRGTNIDTKNQIGSWMLLIRIAIMSSGILLAFVISGFPIDKITIILSALGVGIGFGLQSITNNLLSGIIIAFEKPIYVGDIVEVGGQLGKMKSMGIRSSIITTFDGADVIIPNGELLNQNLTNWTLGSAKRRFEIKLGVAYGTDLQKAKQLIQDILENHQEVLKVPEPMIWVVNFGDCAIDFSVKYWVSNFGIGSDVMSDVLISIDEKFRENNIEIPFPQREIKIKGELPSRQNEK